jgi:hypothetical protein
MIDNFSVGWALPDGQAVRCKSSLVPRCGLSAAILNAGIRFNGYFRSTFITLRSIPFGCASGQRSPFDFRLSTFDF